MGGKGELGTCGDERSGVRVGAGRCICRGTIEEDLRDTARKVRGDRARDGKGEAKGATCDIEAGPGGEEVSRGRCEPAVAVSSGGGIGGDEAADEGVDHQA